MKKISIFLFIILVIIGFGVWYRFYLSDSAMEKIYVAAEGDGVINVIDSATRKIIRTVDLSIAHEGGKVKFLPHNVQVAPDGKTVWVSANSSAHEGHSSRLVNTALAHGDESAAGGIEPDEVIVLDPNKKDRIIARIETDLKAQLAHVTVSADGAFAYVTAQKKGVIYKIDARKKEIVSEIPFAKDSQPHGMRLSPDGKKAYIAVLTGRALGIVDLTNDSLALVPLAGQGVQAGVTPDGKYAVASLYDTKSLALYEVATGAVSYIPLPELARGPVQMYPTPDSKFFYLADQGYYFGQPTSEFVYKIDIEKRVVIKEIKAGKAPHGIVVAKDGKYAYVTNLLSNNVSVIDTATDLEITQIPTGKDPNGISIWNKITGGTP